MKRSACFAVALAMGAVLLSGCGGARVPDKVDEPSVAVSSGGRISAWFVEDFEEDYYSLSELAGMAADEAADFNDRQKGRGGKKAAVTVKKVELIADGGTRIVVSYQFDGWESYTDFCGEVLFYGTVEEALREGYSMGVVLKDADAEEDSALTEEDLRQASGRKIIITDVRANIYCPGKVTHISGGLVNEDGSIDTRNAEETVYILMK